MKIAIFTDTYYPDVNGIAVSTKTLVDVLKKHDHEVIVVTSNYDNKVPTKENGVYYIALSSKRRKNAISIIRDFKIKLYRTIASFKPDIIHNQTNGPIGQLGRYTANRLSIPFVYTYHTHYEEYATYVGNNFFRRVFRAYERRYFKHLANISTEFIAPSLKIKNYLRKKGIDKCINVIPTGYNFSQFEIDESVKKDVKYLSKKYEIENGEKVLLYVGSLSREKNLDFLITNFKTFIDQNDNKYRLLIVGEGNQWDTLLELIKQQELTGKVELVGKVNHDKIKSYLSLANLFVNASTSETQNMAVIEAMLTKCLVLVKEDENTVEMIEDGVNGFIYSNEKEFIKQLNLIFSTKEEELESIRDKAYDYVTKECGVETYYQKVVEVYSRAQRKNW